MSGTEPRNEDGDEGEEGEGPEREGEKRERGKKPAEGEEKPEGEEGEKRERGKKPAEGEEIPEGEEGERPVREEPVEGSNTDASEISEEVTENDKSGGDHKRKRKPNSEEGKEMAEQDVLTEGKRKHPSFDSEDNEEDNEEFNPEDLKRV